MIFFNVSTNSNFFGDREDIICRLGPVNYFYGLAMTVIALYVYAIAKIIVEFQVTLKKSILVMATSDFEIKQTKHFINLSLRRMLRILDKLLKNIRDKGHVIGFFFVAEILITTVIVEEIDNAVLSCAFRID